MDLAEGNPALRAAAGLLGGALGVKLAVDFAEIVPARIGFTLRRHALADRRELQQQFHFRSLMVGTSPEIAPSANLGQLILPFMTMPLSYLPCSRVYRPVLNKVVFFWYYISFMAAIRGCPGRAKLSR